MALTTRCVSALCLLIGVFSSAIVEMPDSTKNASDTDSNGSINSSSESNSSNESTSRGVSESATNSINESEVQLSGEDIPGDQLTFDQRRHMVERLQRETEGMLTAVDVEDVETGNSMTAEQIQIAVSWALGRHVPDEYFYGDEKERVEDIADTTEGSWVGWSMSEGQPWPDRKVVYAYHPDIVDGAKNVYKSAIKELEQKTCVTFEEVPHESTTNLKGWVELISSDDGCWANVGATGGKHQSNLAWGCRWHAIALHELIHVLGVTHEQNRPDRDHFVEIKWDNIKDKDEKGHNFEKSEHAYSAMPYDYGSIMHYSAHAFSKEITTFSSIRFFQKPFANLARLGWDTANPTIRTRNDHFMARIGQRNGMSNGDVEQLNHMYQCSKLALRSDPHAGSGIQWQGGINIGSGYEQVGVACNPGYVMSSCSCWHDDGDCRGAVQSTAEGGTCIAGGQKGWQGAAKGLTARVVCLRPSSPSYVVTRLTQSSSSGDATMSCAGDYRLVGCSCLTHQGDNCDATPSMNSNADPGSCTARSSKTVYAQAVCMRAPALTEMQLVTGTPAKESIAECPEGTELTGCSCAGHPVAEGLCAGARAAGHASNLCNAHAKEDGKMVVAYALCAKLLSNKEVWMPAAQAFAGGILKDAKEESSEELSPVQSVYCDSWSWTSAGTRGCKSVQLQHRTSALFKCPENKGDSECQSVTLTLKPNHVDVELQSNLGVARCPVGWVAVQLSCTGDDCAYFKLKCAAPPPEAAWHLSGGISYSEWFSGETNNAMGTCGESLVIGVQCSDKSLFASSSCQHLRLICRRVAISAADDADRRGTFDLHLNSGTWSTWISSTGMKEHVTQFDFRDKHTELQNSEKHPIQKVACKGANCDDLRFFLVPQFGYIHSSFSLSGTASIWTVTFREGEMRCPDGHFVVGITCEHSYCETKKLLCATPTSDKWLLTGEPYYSYCFTNEFKYAWQNWWRDLKEKFTGREKMCVGTSADQMPDMQSCGQDGILVGLKCHGGSCDRLQLICRTVDSNVNITTTEIESSAPILSLMQQQGMYNGPEAWDDPPVDGAPVKYEWTGTGFTGGDSTIDLQRIVSHSPASRLPLLVFVLLSLLTSVFWSR